MVKIGDIAKVTGFSITTVSKALNGYTDISEKTKVLVLDKAKEMGYIPNASARSLITKRTYTIGIMLDEILKLGLQHPFFAGIIQAFREEVESQGYDILFLSSELGNTQITSYIDHCRQRNVDGVFILCTNFHDQAVQQLIHSDIPSVLFDVKDDKANSVYSNHYQGAFDAVKYLYGLGHRKIAHIYGTELTYVGAERKQAYIDAIHYYGLTYREDYLRNGSYFDFKYGKQAMDELLDLSEPPTAVFVAGDIMALGAMKACYERGVKIPEDISIMGFDNIKMLDWVTPGLTTVAQDVPAIAKALSKSLMSGMKDKAKRYDDIIVPTYIVERESCKDLNKVNQ